MVNKDLQCLCTTLYTGIEKRTETLTFMASMGVRDYTGAGLGAVPPVGSIPVQGKSHSPTEAEIGG